MSETLHIRPIESEDAGWVRTLLVARWGGTDLISRGRTHRGDELDGFVAVLRDHRVGLLTFRREGDEIEVVSLDSIEESRGVGTRLLVEVETLARCEQVRRLWLITSNDNIEAMRFYQRRGWRMTTVHCDAISDARLLKPSIPRTGRHDIEIRDEIEFERVL